MDKDAEIVRLSADCQTLEEQVQLLVKTELKLRRAQAELINSKKEVEEYSRTLEQKVQEKVGELKRSQDQLIQSAKMAAVGRLVSGLAHEINNPVGIILGFAQYAVRKTKKNDPFRVPLKSIEREAIRCKRLMSELLVFSRTALSEMQSCKMNDIIEDVLFLVRSQIKVANIRIVRRYGKISGGVLINRNQVQQVLLNLCNNAIDAMPAGGRLTIATQQAGRYMEIRIADNGTGMSDEVKRHVFEPFFTTKQIGKGTGLGLSLCYEIVQKHGGTIDCESDAGKGATFTIKFPLQ